MSLVTYTARRSLVPGHAVGETHELELLVRDSGVVPGRAHRSVQQEALAGAVESILYMHKRQYAVTLAPLQLEELDLVLEFIDSVINKETFTFAPYGIPGLTLSAILLEPTGYDLQEFMAQEGADDYFSPPRMVIREL